VIKQYASKFADSQAAIPQRELLAIGNLYSTIAAYAEAETWFRRAMEENPNVDRLVVQSLVAQGKRNEAVAMALERAGGQVTPELALTLASILTTTDVQAEPLPEAEAVLTEAQQLFADRSDVVEAAAVVKASRGDYEEAITLFRRLVELNPENVVALNNLATLLAERPSQRTEALELIERAIKIGGPDPMLLDTQGTIFVKINDFERAIACLEEATSGGIADARYYLHLAAAYHGAGRSDEAAIMLKEARLLGLERFVLTSDDRELLFTLDTALSSSI
jgi:tetratricopeptide (TPR) repeat protein